jgi:Uncharacterized conserved protein
MTAPRAGHRTLPHTADTRVQAWGPTFPDCVAQTVLGAVASFVDASGAAPVAHRELRVAPGEPGDLVVAVLDEVIYLLDVAGQVPVGVTVTPAEAGHLVRFDLADVADLPQVGAVPKAVSLHGLRVEERPDGWLCEVTLDV